MKIEQAMIAEVLRVARGEIGVHESGGNNCGPRVKEYLAAVGLPQGNPWCAAFVAWCFQRAGLERWPATGDTWAIETWARQQKVLNVVPEPGDVFLLLGSDGKPIHTGFVTSVAGGRDHTAFLTSVPYGRIGTTEGNTGGPSDTDGDGVYAKSRPMGSCNFVRWARSDMRPAKRPERTVKIFAHDGKQQIVVDGETYKLKSLMVDGTPANVISILGTF